MSETPTRRGYRRLVAATAILVGLLISPVGGGTLVAAAAVPPGPQTQGQCVITFKPNSGQKIGGQTVSGSTLTLDSVQLTRQQCDALYVASGGTTTTTVQGSTTTSTSSTTTTSTTMATTTTTSGGGSGLPSSKLDLSRWKLTLPINTSHEGNPDEWLQPELNGYSSQYFHVNATNNGVVFYTPVTGSVSTGGSSYPRTELREMTGTDPEDEGPGWTNNTGFHVMQITERINHIPDAKRHLVAGQVHDDDDDVFMVRLEASLGGQPVTPRLFIERDGDEIALLDANYVIGTTFTVRIEGSGGRFRVYYNGVQKMDLALPETQMYFKAGSYPQSNASQGEQPGAYGEVEIFALTVAHS